MKNTTFTLTALLFSSLILISAAAAAGPLSPRVVQPVTGSAITTLVVPYHGAALQSAEEKPCNTGNITYNAEVSFTIRDAAMHYNFTGIASETVSKITVEPRIFRIDGNDTIALDTQVFTADMITCFDTPTCSANDTFVPVWDTRNITSSYFSNATIIFYPYEECSANVRS